MLDVDDADDFVLGNDGDREEGLKGVLGKIFEVLEARVVIGFARNGKKAAFARHPSGEALVQSKANAAQVSRGFLIAGSEQHEFVLFHQVHQARIALKKIL